MDPYTKQSCETIHISSPAEQTCTIGSRVMTENQQSKHVGREPQPNCWGPEQLSREASRIRPAAYSLNMGREPHPDRQSPNKTAACPQLLSNKVVIATSNSQWEQNRPDGHQPEIYTEMAGKETPPKSISRTSRMKKPNKGLPTPQHRTHTIERQQTH